MNAARVLELERRGALYVPPRPRLELVPHAGMPRQRDVLRSSGAVAASACKPGGVTPTPPAVPNLQMYLLTVYAATIANQKNGVGDSFAFNTPVAGSTRLTDAAAPFSTTDDQGQQITITGAPSAGNNGTFFTFPNGGTTTTIDLDNPAGVTEAFAGTWNLLGRFSQINDVVAARPYANSTVIERPSVVPNLSPGKNLWGITAAGLTASPTQYLFNTDAAFASQFQTGNVSCAFRAMAPTGLVNPLPTVMRIDAGTTTGQRLTFGFPSTTIARCNWVDGGGTTQLSVTITSITNSTWFTAGFSFDATARTVTYYKDGVLVGTSSVGTARTPTGFTRTVVGKVETSSFAGGYLGGFALGTAKWTAAEQLAVHTAFLAAGLP